MGFDGGAEGVGDEVGVGAAGGLGVTGFSGLLGSVGEEGVPPVSGSAGASGELGGVPTPGALGIVPPPINCAMRVSIMEMIPKICPSNFVGKPCMLFAAGVD